MVTKKINIIVLAMNIVLLTNCFGMEDEPSAPSMPHGMQHPSRRASTMSRGQELTGSDSDDESSRSRHLRHRGHGADHRKAVCDDLGHLGEDVCCLCQDGGRCALGAGLMLCGSCGCWLARELMVNNVGLAVEEQFAPSGAECCCFTCGALACLGACFCLSSLVHKCYVHASVQRDCRAARLEIGCRGDESSSKRRHHKKSE